MSNLTKVGYKPTNFNQQKNQVAFGNAQKTVRVAINGGVGRIGKTFFRENFANLGVGHPTASTARLINKIQNGLAKIQIVAMNTGEKMTPENLVNLLKSDNIMGFFPGKLSAKAKKDIIELTVGEGKNAQKIDVFGTFNAKELPWNDLGIDVVVDSTGAFLTKEKLAQHLEQGAKKAIASAPAKDDMKTIVYGINDNIIKPEDQLFSNASCTTTCAAPIVKLMNDTFGVKNGFLQTTHSSTATQFVQDTVKRGGGVGRGLLNNILPATTGAAKAIGRVIPELNGKLNGLAARVQADDVSMLYATLNLKKATNVDEIKAVLKAASESKQYQDLLAHAEKNATSTDIKGRHESAIYVEDQIQVIDNDMVAIPAFYDNEWGYTRSLTDLVKKVGSMIKK